MFLPAPLSGLLASEQLSMAQFHALSAAHNLNDKTWFSVQDLGAGASVLAAQRGGAEREVWVLQLPAPGPGPGGRSAGLFAGSAGHAERDDTADRALLAALTGSLAAREKLIAELATCRAPARALPSSTAPPGGGGGARAGHWRDTRDTRDDRDDDWRLDVKEHARLREREAELEERERLVLKREKWVVDEMRKMSERSR